MKSLLIDLDKCALCSNCDVKCNYPCHEENNGMLALKEILIFKYICRHCEKPLCVEICPKNALKKENGIIKRYSLLCTGCELCLIVCPFGVITKDILTIKTSVCDLCKDRDPICAETCKYNAIKFGKIKEDPKNHIYKFKEGLYVHYTPWKKET